ncbi:glycine oxidase ThiO [Lottiidibacillus patelloidae]|uniref:glycine oxidase n=1 Tax=Lottiidibacillus patelloidae TaxID=2670334 RepID=A0A263BV97_9BACI|nr:glycine oxidase ThiO [Lottiidibacillus patelloidae]OZM57671.1 glycine oxidase ThiO [Lottiidibacillus patelloidae]
MSKKIIVIGAGVIGLSTALECQMRGHEVILLEKGKCGGQASGAAAGLLAPFSEIEEDPDDFFTLCLSSLRLFSKWKDLVMTESNHSFEYTTSGTVHAYFHEADMLKIEMRMNWQKKFQVKAEKLTAKQIRTLEPSLSQDAVAGLYYPEESHLYAPDYLIALEKACENIGVTIHENCGKVMLENELERCTVKDEHGNRYSGDIIVLCSGAWSNEWEKYLNLAIPVFPIRGQICAYDQLDKHLNHIVYTSQGYLVSKANNTLVCGASEDIAGFNTAPTIKGIERLKNWNSQVLPMLRSKAPFSKWAGLRPATQDGFPFIGHHPNSENFIFACGHYRNGILLSPITANIVADLVEGKKSVVPLEAFAPDRFTY